MNDKEKAKRIVSLLKNIKEEQNEVDSLLEELGIESCSAGLRTFYNGEKYRAQYQVVRTGATRMAEILGVGAERRHYDEYRDFVYAGIGDGIAVMALEGKK